MASSVASPRVPGSEKTPFRPINPHGRTPQVLRADGTVIDWKSPLAEPMFQVRVQDRERGDIAIGPKCALGWADQLCATTKLAIKSGRITGWSAPYVVSVAPERAVARVF